MHGRTDLRPQVSLFSVDGGVVRTRIEGLAVMMRVRVRVGVGVGVRVSARPAPRRARWPPGTAAPPQRGSRVGASPAASGAPWPASPSSWQGPAPPRAAARRCLVRVRVRVRAMARARVRIQVRVRVRVRASDAVVRRVVGAHPLVSEQVLADGAPLAARVGARFVPG